MKHVDYFAVCGAKGCIRACMDALEKSGKIKNTFKNPFYRKQGWTMTNSPSESKEGLNPFRNEWLDKSCPGSRTNEDFGTGK